MNKTEFLNELDICLKQMQALEREKFIIYYDEMISDYVESGMKEPDAVKKVGLPKDIAAEILAEADTIVLPFPQVENKFLLTTLLILGSPLWGSLLICILLVAICYFLVLLCIPLATGMGALSFLIASLVSIAGSPFVMGNGFWVGLTQLGLGIASLGIALLFAYLTVPATKLFFEETKKTSAYFYQKMRRSLKL